MNDIQALVEEAMQEYVQTAPAMTKREIKAAIYAAVKVISIMQQALPPLEDKFEGEITSEPAAPEGSAPPESEEPNG